MPDEAAARPADDGPAGWRLALPAHLATLVVAFLFLLRLNEGGWFFRDEWAFLVDRGLGADDRGFFAPHNEHWTTLPIVVFRLLFAAFGVRTYVPYVVVLVLVHLVVAHLAWRVMRRSGANPWVATAAVPVLLVFGPGADNLLWAFQITFVGSLAFGLGHMLLVDHPGRFGRRDLAGWGLALGGLMCSGIGVPMVAAAGLVALARRGAMAFLQTAGPPAAVFAVWWLAAGRGGLERDAGTAFSPGSLPAYVWTGVRATVEAVARSPLAAGVLAAVVMAGVVLLLLRGRAPVPALACAAGAPMILVVTGIGRAALGPEQAASPRYLYLVAALLLPLIAAAASELGRLLPALWILPTAAALVVSGSVLVELERRADAQAARDGFVRRTILAGVYADRLEGPIIGARPDRRNAPNLQLDELLALRDAGDLPPSPPPSDGIMLQLAQGLQVRVNRGPAESATGGGVLGEAKGVEVSPSGGCLLVEPSGERPRIRFQYPSSAQLGLRLEPRGELAFAVTRAGLTAAPHLVKNRLVTFAVPDAAVTLRFQPGHALTVCGMAAEPS